MVDGGCGHREKNQFRTGHENALNFPCAALNSGRGSHGHVSVQQRAVLLAKLYLWFRHMRFVAESTAILLVVVVVLLLVLVFRHAAARGSDGVVRANALVGEWYPVLIEFGGCFGLDLRL